MIKILGINGSPRVDDSTRPVLQAALDAAMEVDERLLVQRLDLGDHRIAGCIDCSGCTDYGRCGINDDFNRLLPQLTDPELAGIIIASPVHLGSVTAQCKALLDRTQLLQRNGGAWRGLVGAGLAVGTGPGGGQELTLQCLHAAMLFHDMLVVQSGGTEHLRLDGPLSCAAGAPDEQCLVSAGRLGRRVAETVMQRVAAA